MTPEAPPETIEEGTETILLVDSSGYSLDGEAKEILNKAVMGLSRSPLTSRKCHIR